MALTPAQQSARGRLGGLTRLTRYPIEDLSRAGQAGLRASLLREVTEDATARGEQLDEAEIARRLDARVRLHFARLAWRSVRSRRRGRRELEAQEP